MSGQGKARYAFESHTHSGLGSGGSGSGGTSIYSGSGSPSSSIGVAGDFYVDTTNKVFWGPKVGSSWPSSFSLAGTPGATGATGPAGAVGAAGAAGANGAAATVTVGATSVGVAGSNPVVTNSGTSTNAILNFTIPRGATGATGATGPQGPQGVQGPQGPAGTGTGTSGGTSAYVPAGLAWDNGAIINRDDNPDITYNYAVGFSQIPQQTSLIRESSYSISSEMYSNGIVNEIQTYIPSEYMSLAVGSSASVNFSAYPIRSNAVFSSPENPESYASYVGDRRSSYVSASDITTVRFPYKILAGWPGMTATVSALLANNYPDQTNFVYSTSPTSVTVGQWGVLEVTYTSSNVPNGVVVVPSLNFNLALPNTITATGGVYPSQTLKVLVASPTYGAVKNVQDIDLPATASRSIASAKISPYLAPGAQLSTAIKTLTATTSGNSTSGGSQTTYRLASSGSYFIDSRQALGGVTVELPSYLSTYVNGIASTVNTLDIDLYVLPGGSSGGVRFRGVPVWCTHCNSTVKFLGGELGDVDNLNTAYAHLKFSSVFGWIMTEHIEGIPPVKKPWPHTGLAAAGGGETYIRGYSMRYEGADRDIELFSNILVTYIPLAIRQNMVTEGVTYIVGPTVKDNDIKWNDRGFFIGVTEGRTVFTPALYQGDNVSITSGEKSVTTILHETGHIVDEFGYWWSTGVSSARGTWLTSTASFQNLYASAKADTTWDTSQYANTNILEWFAEAIWMTWYGQSALLLKTMGNSTSRVATWNALMSQYKLV